MREPKLIAGGKEAMGMAAFQALLEQYGAEPRRWPDDLRASAESLLALSVEARAEQHRAATLDALLDRLEAPAVSDARVARVVAGALADLAVPGMVRARVPFPRRVADLLAPLALAWPRAAGLAACTAAGILVGAFTPVTSTAAGGTGAEGTVAAATANDLPTALLTPSALESLFQ
ncbi:hypothetical protein [Niveispirillum sp. KHB5.9]|uniref:hypothetical protein n=1 Tax=Niveispirillum sp. KHB5.9 TaxID=3400269 RepID=UPI003A8C7161